MDVRLIATGALALLLVGSHTYAYLKGRNDMARSIEVAQLEGRIKVIKSVQSADKQADTANDDELCALLGGCGVPDNSGN